MIVSSHKDEQLAKEDLLTLKVYFIENAGTRTLKEKYLFDFSIEPYGEYNALIISPMKDDSLRNKLLVLLAPQFPDIFYVMSETKSIDISKYPSVKALNGSPKISTTSATLHKKEKSWFDEMGLQWFAIWLLAVIGLILSIRNRRKMGQLERTQKEIKVEQKNIEKEITQLGEENA
ncbi:MAG TPA: hypothetical protein EYG70_06155 [Sulfurimonas sp.]|nr:hypothetical protein [Sulfurimonas sp.]